MAFDGLEARRYADRRTGGGGADTLGTFALELPAARVEPGRPIDLTVRVSGGSMRWFAIQEYTDTIGWLYALR